MRNCTRLAFAWATCALVSPPQASAQTSEFLDAPTVKNMVRVQWDPSSKKATWAVDGEDVFRELSADKLFLTKTSVFVTYPRLNPLKLQATAAVTIADDPGYAIIAKLAESIFSVVSMLRPEPGQSPVTSSSVTLACPATGDAAEHMVAAKVLVDPVDPDEGLLRHDVAGDGHRTFRTLQTL